MIALQHISLRTGDFSLEDISLRIEKGTFNVLLGPTGSGKTMLLELIAGLKKCQSGTLTIDGKDAAALPPEQRGLSYVPQDAALFPHLNVRDNVLYSLRIKGTDKKAQQEKLDELIPVLEIGHLLDRQIGKLSGGEKQRVALARALAAQTPILLLDEPTAAIHETLQEDLCLFLKRIQRQFGLTVLMTTHHKDSAFLLADTIHFIDRGKLFFSIDKADFQKKPLSRNAADFFGIRNVFQVVPSGQAGLWCPELGATLVFSDRFPTEGEPFFIGVRPEDIRYVKEEDRSSGSANYFDAEIISILEKENSASIRLRPLHGKGLVTMDISIYNQKKFRLTTGKVIQCRIKEESVRVVY